MILTTKQAGERLGVSRYRVQQLITDGRLKATRFGRAYMIEESALEAVRERPSGRDGWAKNRPQPSIQDDEDAEDERWAAFPEHAFIPR